MGTNYYWAPPDAKCPTCGHEKERLHIGKSSSGWCFSLHVIPEEQLTSLSDWETRWQTGSIVDEYGRALTAKEMLSVITERSWSQSNKERPDGWVSWPAFYAANHAEPGPNNLLRHQIGRYCCGHGDGTWDLMPGEFS